jgi:hypothetical protein
MIQELWGKVNHRGLIDFLFSHVHAWACAKSIQMKLSEEYTTISYHIMNKTMQASIYMTCYELLVNWNESYESNYKASIK